MEAQTTDRSAENAFVAYMNACGVCKESFLTKEPKLLPCLHTFCKDCIATDPDSNIVKCPTCKQECTTVEVIENQFVLNDNNSEAAPTNEEKSNMCTACEESSAATSFCIECTEWLCDQCVQAHRRVRVTKDHTIQPKDSVVTNNSVNMSQRILTCPVHKQEALKLFCETCDRLTCRDCQLSEHKDHKYQFVHEASHQYKLFLQTLLNKIKEKRTYIENAKTLINKRYKEISDREQYVTNDIKTFAVKMISEINRRGKRLLADLTAVCSAKKSQLSQKNAEILSLSMKLDHCMKFAEYIVDHGSNSAILYSKRILVNQLRHVLRTRCEVPNPNHVVDIRFNYDSPQFLNQINHMGSLIVDGVPFQGFVRGPQPGNHGAPPPNGQGLPRSRPYFPPNLEGLNPQQKALLTKKMLQLQQQRAAAAASGNSASGSSSPIGGPMGNHAPLPSGAASRLSHLPNRSSTVSSTNTQTVKTGSVFYPPSGIPTSKSQHNHMINLAQIHQRLVQRQQQATSSTTTTVAQPIIIQPHPQPSASPSSTIHHGRSLLPPNTTPIQVSSANSGGSPVDVSSQQPSLVSRSAVVLSRSSYSPQVAMSSTRDSMVSPNSTTGISSSVGQVSGPSVRNGSSPAGSMSDTGSMVRSPVIFPDCADQSSTDPLIILSRPSSSDSNKPSTTDAAHIKQERLSTETEMPSCSFGSMKVKGEVLLDDEHSTNEDVAILSLNTSPTDFNFDADPASFLESIKKENERFGGDNAPLCLATQSGTMDGSTAAPEDLTNEDNLPFNLNEPITDQVMNNSGSSNNSNQEGNETTNGETLAQQIPATQQSDDPSEDYCGVCHNGGDLLCCDTCPKVFHLQCHVPSLGGEPSGAWSCSLCTQDAQLRVEVPEHRLVEEPGLAPGVKRKAPTGLTDRELKACERILLELFCHAASVPFHEPVSKSVPNYYKIVTNPMDFTSIKCKLSRSHFNHYETVEDFISDVRLVFTNCALYNAPDSEVGKAGRGVEDFFDKLRNRFLPYLDSRSVTPCSESGDKDKPKHKRKRKPDEVVHYC